MNSRKQCSSIDTQAAFFEMAQVLTFSQNRDRPLSVIRDNISYFPCALGTGPPSFHCYRGTHASIRYSLLVSVRSLNFQADSSFYRLLLARTDLWAYIVILVMLVVKITGIHLQSITISNGKYIHSSYYSVITFV